MPFHLPTNGLDSVGVFLRRVRLNLNAGVRQLYSALLGMFGGVRQSSGSVLVGYFTYRVFGPYSTRIVVNIVIRASKGLRSHNDVAGPRAKVNMILARPDCYYERRACAPPNVPFSSQYMCYLFPVPFRSIPDDPNAK